MSATVNHRQKKGIIKDDWNAFVKLYSSLAQRQLCWWDSFKNNKHADSANGCHRYEQNSILQWLYINSHKKGGRNQTYLLEGNHPNETADAGDVGVVEAQQGENGVSLQEMKDGINL